MLAFIANSGYGKCVINIYGILLHRAAVSYDLINVEVRNEPAKD
jgi:hypothetical protein